MASPGPRSGHVGAAAKAILDIDSWRRGEEEGRVKSEGGVYCRCHAGVVWRCQIRMNATAKRVDRCLEAHGAQLSGDTPEAPDLRVRGRRCRACSRVLSLGRRPLRALLDGGRVLVEVRRAGETITTETLKAQRGGAATKRGSRARFPVGETHHAEQFWPSMRRGQPSPTGRGFLLRALVLLQRKGRSAVVSLGLHHEKSWRGAKNPLVSSTARRAATKPNCSPQRHRGHGEGWFFQNRFPPCSLSLCGKGLFLVAARHSVSLWPAAYEASTRGQAHRFPSSRSWYRRESRSVSPFFRTTR